MRHVALLTRQWPQPNQQQLNERCETRLLVRGTDLDGDFFRTLNRDVSILCSSFLDPVGDALLDALPGLKFIAHFGRWHAPIEPLRARGIRLADTGAAGAAEAADFALTQLFAAMRRTAQPLIEHGDFRTLDQGLAPSINGMTIGLAGFDATALALAARCRALGMPVRCWLPASNAHMRLPGSIERATSMLDLAAGCDAISLHGTAGDGPLVTADVLVACPLHSVIVNVTAAALVDGSALIEALSDYVIGGAALDVHSDSPVLTQCPNLLLTPRLATNTAPARTEMAARVVTNILAWLDDRPPPDELI